MLKHIRNRPPLFTVIIISVVCLLILPYNAAHASASWPDTQLFDEYRWLAPPGRGWLVQELDLTQGVSKESLGAVGVGDGVVFGLIGLEMPQNAMSNIIGPGYETNENFFGPVWHELVKVDESGKVAETVSFTKSRIYRVPKSNLVLVQEAGPDFVLTTITYPYQFASIVRVFHIEDLNNAGTGDLRLLLRKKAVHEKESLQQEWFTDVDANQRELSFFSYDDKGPVRFDIIDGETGLLAIETYEYDGVKFGAYQMQFWHPDYRFPPVEHDMSPPDMSLEYHGLSLVLPTTLEIESDSGRIDAFFYYMLALLKTQTEATTSAVGVMARYSGAWCRDGYGPVRFYTKTGEADAAYRIASFYDYATRVLGFRNRYPLDVNIWEGHKKIDWGTVKPQQGDDPNILIMHIYNVWRATGDEEFIREHYGFMRRNLMGQDTGDWRLPFHGDETYQVYVMMQEGTAMKDFYSVDTSFWYAVAAESLAEMADVIGKTDDAAEYRERARQCREHVDKYYWDDERGYFIPFLKKSDLSPATSPFANINLRPLWIGYADPSDPKMRRNVITTAKALMRKSGTMKTTKRVAYYTGMTPGLLLWNLKAIGLTDRADMAFHGLFDAAMSPLGDFAEAYSGDDHWLDYTHMPNVYRPWESAINADAVLFYLTGYKYDHRAGKLTLQPHLPPGVSDMTIDNLYAGPHRVAVTMNRSNDEPWRLDIAVENTGESDIQIELITEVIKGETAPVDCEVFEYPDYQRSMWRFASTLEPGQSMQGLSANNN